MKGMMLNALLGVMLGRFGSVWRLLIFIPIVAAEVGYGVCVYNLSASACLRRGTALLICGQLAFLLGALLRPMTNER
ncbi:hypothetical protein SAMN02799622_04009 [Methylobacterium sp. UNC378MF]|jgi:ABC-type spermidine/putrescine transport system permease subunit II|uniref:hypothetical protein n=1 Tax=unclassified Methylobacterium TaxID=2615210 RepID=UPI00088FCDB5|nr:MULTISPECIES: hypothetical protein [unclassified Methylobacterium]KAA0122407.1 hypothetical protein CIW48_17975 [Methylobacterium sp. P1-11]SDA27414.1 hypothetical protein SAMN02799622_04009 [Methylobacterium sp. UNC378MF]